MEATTGRSWKGNEYGAGRGGGGASSAGASAGAAGSCAGAGGGAGSWAFADSDESIRGIPKTKGETSSRRSRSRICFFYSARPVPRAVVSRGALPGERRNACDTREKLDVRPVLKEIATKASEPRAWRSVRDRSRSSKTYDGGRRGAVARKTSNRFCRGLGSRNSGWSSRPVADARETPPAIR